MSASAYLTPRLEGLSLKLHEALARVERSHEDEEAIHDLRVVIRRLRSLLKPARTIYGIFHTEAVRAALKAVADATGELRDEEVLLQTLDDLPVPTAAGRGRAAWKRRRKAREKELRARFLSLLASGEAHRAAALLDALLLLPVDPGMDRELPPFAARVVEKASRRVQARAGTDPADSEALHQLRILYKRLRYAAEGFAEVLPPHLAPLAKIAERFQKLLGEIHDIDVAHQAVLQETSLSPATRDALVQALAASRAQVVLRLQAARTAPPSPAPTASAAPAAPAPAPASPKAASGKQAASASRAAVAKKSGATRVRKKATPGGSAPAGAPRPAPRKKSR